MTLDRHRLTSPLRTGPRTRSRTRGVNRLPVKRSFVRSANERVPASRFRSRERFIKRRADHASQPEVTGALCSSARFLRAPSSSQALRLSHLHSPLLGSSPTRRVQIIELDIPAGIELISDSHPTIDPARSQV